MNITREVAEEVAAAIVAQAADDFRSAKADEADAQAALAETRHFFRTNATSVLCNYDGKTLLKMLEDEPIQSFDSKAKRARPRDLLKKVRAMLTIALDALTDARNAFPEGKAPKAVCEAEDAVLPLVLALESLGENKKRKKETHT